MNPKEKISKPGQKTGKPKKANDRSKRKYSNVLIWSGIAIIILTTFFIYLKAVNYRFLFNWDDDSYIIDNVDIKDLKWANIKLFFTSFYVGNYQPLTMLFYALEYKLAGLNASLFHFNNILLHLINTYLVFVLIKKISPENIIVPLITASLFAVHPMHVESVAWVSERKDLLYSFFFLLSLIMYIKYLKEGDLKYLTVAGLCFICSCLSKSAAVILPLVMLLFDYYTNRKYSWKMFLEKIPFLAVSVITGIVAIYSQQDAIRDMPPQMSFIEQVAVVSHSFISYIVRAFVPVNLAVIYPYPKEIGSVLPVLYYLAIPCVAGLIILVWYSRKWGKDGVFGTLFFLINIILVLQFLPVGAAALADRYTYMSYTGIFFIIGKLTAYMTSNTNAFFRKYKNSVIIAFLLVFIVFSVISHQRVKQWTDVDTLFSDGIEKYPHSYLSHYIRGVCYLKYHALILNASDPVKKEMYVKKSMDDFSKAILFRRNYPDAYSNRGYAKGLLNNYPAAINDYDSALLLDPKYTNALINRGEAKRELKDYNGALEDFTKAIEVSPQSAIAYHTRGSAKFFLEDYKGALEDYDSALKIDTLFTMAYNNRGSTKFLLQDYEGALADYNISIKLDPQNAEALKNREVVLAKLMNTVK
ncbi:MAG TPA: tetratricopeptide repeat protein [Bacteroidales bacterium]|nr:tetratricopeptide repeat protein [Bacteroidales bacterium]